MPNWCVNELKIAPPWTGGPLVGGLVIDRVLDFVRETIPNFERRIQILIAREPEEGKFYWLQQQDAERRLEFDFNSIIPYPEKFRERDYDAATMSDEEFYAKYRDTQPLEGERRKYDRFLRKDGYNSGGYEWCVANWGSKWNAKDVVWIPQRNTFLFDTPWCPPYGVLEALHKQFPETHLYLEFFERGMNVVGGCEYIPESEWDENDFYYENVSSLQQWKEQYEKYEKEYEEREKNEEKTIDAQTVIDKAKGKLELVTGFSEGLTPKTSSWQAGRAYNSWCTEYFGSKGG